MVGGGPGVLETPTYVSAAVFAIFLLLSLSIDKAIHAIDQKLGKMKRKRLKTAFHHIIQELMLMGLMSLVLIVAQDSIAGTCVKKTGSDSLWVILHQVDHCHPCLEKTKTISSSYKEDHHCPFWEDDDHTYPSKSKTKSKSRSKTHIKASGYESHSTEENVNHRSEIAGASPDAGFHEEDDHHHGGHRRKLLAGGSEGGCKEGYVPLVSVAVLHEIHIFIFLLGVTHVVTSVLMIVLASGSTILSAHKKASSERHSDMVAKCIQGPPELQDIEGAPISDDANLESDMDGEKTDRLTGSLYYWTAPDRDMSKIHNVILEYIVSFFKQFIKPISMEEFHLMKASFMINHKRVTNFDFMDYIMAGLDDDFIKVVTINLNRGLTVAIFILLLAPIDWRTWEAAGVLILLFTLPLIVTTKLVSIVRHVTRGGHVHELDARVFWFGKPQLLLPVINFMLFMCSLVFASMIFFAWQFGEFSCLFYGNSPAGRFSVSNWTWVVMLIVTVGAYAHLSLVTLPTYSFVVHMGGIHWHKDLLPQRVQGKLLSLARRAKKGASKPATSEVTSTGLPSAPNSETPSVDGKQAVPQSVVPS